MRQRVRSGIVALLLLALAACITAGGGAVSSTVASAEPQGGWVRRVDPFPVLNAAGEPYAHPFLGGFDVPRPQFVDIDADRDLDLFIQERSDELLFLENTGTPADPRFAWRTDRFRGLSIGEWSRFVDLDDDGDLDLLAEEPFSHIRYYRNVGTPTEARFELAADTLRTPAGEPIFADRQNIPSIVDVDCDGLLDLFLGRVTGTITRYEQAEGGDPMEFRFVEDRWQDIEIIGQIGQAPGAQAPPSPGPFPHEGGRGELQSRPTGSLSPVAGERERERGSSVGDRSVALPTGRSIPTLHGANAMAFVDVDGDGDPDLLWGDFFEPGVLLIRNTGTCENPNFRTEPTPYPVGNPLQTSGYNVPVVADIDADGDRDLFVGVLGGAFNPNRTTAGNLWFLEHTAAGELELRTRRYLDAIDVGSESAPALADLDGDGDLDLLVGNKLDPAALNAARVYHWENVGTPTAPRFRLADTLALGSAYHYAPALGDLDADGDPDLVVGTWNDGVQLFRNTGEPGRFVPAAEPEELVRLTRGSNATPALGDVDGDGDLDLFVGEASGTLNFYRNEGTLAAPRFDLVSDEFMEIDVGRRSHPALADLDGDGVPELIVGREDAGALVFRNVSRGGQVAFEATEIILPLPPYAAPASGDLDADGNLEVVAGGLSGGLVFQERREEAG